MVSPSPATPPNAFRFGSPKLLTNLVYFFLGLFMLETLYNVWILGSGDTDGNSGDSMSRERNGDLGFYGDESEFKKKVAEIRVLARKARDIEQQKAMSEASASSSTVTVDDGDDVDGDSIDVRKEVNKRLIKLQKSYKKPLQPLNSDANGGDFISREEPPISSLKAWSDPNGFEDLKNDKNASLSGESDENGLLDRGEQRKDVFNGDSMGEEESHWLNDEVMKRIVLKVRANEEAGKEPYSGLDSKEMNFFLALIRKFRRKGPDNARQWMEKRIEDIGLSDGMAFDPLFAFAVCAEYVDVLLI